MGKGAFPAVLHCFTGGPRTGPPRHRARPLHLLHRHSDVQELRRRCAQIAAELPADRILVETDAPYLAPGQFRGKRNEPAYVVETAKVLAETRGVSFDDIAQADHRRISSGCSARCRGSGGGRMTHDALTAIHHSRLRLLRRRAAPGAWAGATAIRTIRRTAAAAPRFWSNGARAARRHPRAGRHLAGSARATLDAEVDWLDGVLYTHEHADHTHGIDDLRALFIKRRRRVDVYLDERTGAMMHAAVRLLLPIAARQRISADRHRAPARRRHGR